MVLGAFDWVLAGFYCFFFTGFLPACGDCTRAAFLSLQAVADEDVAAIEAWLAPQVRSSHASRSSLSFFCFVPSETKYRPNCVPLSLVGCFGGCV